MSGPLKVGIYIFCYRNHNMTSNENEKGTQVTIYERLYRFFKFGSWFTFNAIFVTIFAFLTDFMSEPPIIYKFLKAKNKIFL